MNNRNTILLLVLFFGGLLALWWANYAGIRTQQEKTRLAGLVVPALADIKPASITRVEILGDRKGRISLARQSERQWQMKEPVDALADSAMVENLLSNLRLLRPVPGAEAIEAAPASFGLDHPERTLRVFESGSQEPLVTLELGKRVDDRRYVREAGQRAIDVVDARVLDGLTKPAADWREKAMFTLGSFEVEGVSLSGEGRDLKAQRIDGRWRLVKPYKAALDPGKMEGVMATLASLRVLGGEKGFVADDVRDFARYGLDKPRMRFELDPAEPGGKPQVVEIGKPLPDAPDQAYARRADQNDVVAVDTQWLKQLGTGPTALRSRRIADFDPDQVQFVELVLGGKEQSLARGRSGWEITAPEPAKADTKLVTDFLNHLAEAQTSEFFDPAKVPSTDLDKPWLVIKVWTTSERARPPAEAAASSPSGEPALELRLGKRNTVGRILYAQSDDAPSVLALPDNLLDVLPTSPLSLRDHTLLALSPQGIGRLSVRRGGKTFEVVGSAPGKFDQWKMTKPLPAPADVQTVAQLVVMLSNLRAETLVAEEPASYAHYGLESPQLTATWSLFGPAPPKRPGRPEGPATSWTLMVGNPVPRKPGAYFARLSGNALVFTLSPVAVAMLTAELRDRHLLSFNPEHVESLTLRWPDKTVTALRKPSPGAAASWEPAAGSAFGPVNPEQLGALLAALSTLSCARYLQYDGPISPELGLNPPQVTIEVQLSEKRGAYRLRLGSLVGGKLRAATTAPGASGAVAILPETEWTGWVTHPSIAKLPDLPDKVFVQPPP